MRAKQSMGDFSRDAQVVHAACGGDRAAFGELYKRYVRMVHGVLLAHVPYAEVDDLLQDVFLIAMRRLESLREPTASRNCSSATGSATGAICCRAVRWIG